MDQNGDATGRVAIVTAASQGLGAACARELASRGYSLALMSRSGAATDLAEELGGIGFEGSVTEVDDLRALVDGTIDAYGRVDAVVNGTGHPPTGEEILEISDEDWHAGLDMVVLNVVRMARLVTPVMRRQGGGALVNVSTFSTFEPSAAFPVSSTLRSALAGFTKLYTDRYAAEGIRMNNVLPGYMDNNEVEEDVLAAIPMRRPGAVEEIAKTAAFLVSPDASYITGQNIRVDGGLTRSL